MIDICMKCSQRAKIVTDLGTCEECEDNALMALAAFAALSDPKKVGLEGSMEMREKLASAVDNHEEARKAGRKLLGHRQMAKTIGMMTLVGHGDGPYPMEHGNCFGVFLGAAAVASDEEDINVLNMDYENFRELLRRKLITWPIEIERFDESCCAVTDSRIPNYWLKRTPCSMCTPNYLMETVQSYCHQDPGQFGGGRGSD